MNELLDVVLRHAKEAGMEREQIERFIKAGYVPQPKQMEFHAAAAECNRPGGPTYVGYGGTRGQAKSHATLAQATLDDMQTHPGLKFLYLRKIKSKALESFDDLRRKVLQFTEHEYKNSVLRLPNGSFMVMGGFRSESEIDNYLGLEYDGIVIEDAPSLSESKHRAIIGARRTARTDWRVRVYESANPGGVGHGWYRKLFYDPWRKGTETETRFVHTLMGDNVFIDEEYEKYLEGLTGWLRRAWRDGDFEISAGMFFDNWDAERIVIEPFAQSADHHERRGWRFFLTMDWGYQHWCVVYLLGMDRNRTVYVIDEHAQRRWQVPQHVEAINAMLFRYGLQDWQIESFVAGADTFSVTGDSEISIADRFAQAGLPLTRANQDRVSGAAEVLHRLGSEENKPTLYIFNRCHKLIECLPTLEHDPKRPEDVLKVDADDLDGSGGDDPYDALRYGLMGLRQASVVEIGVL